MSKAIPGFSVRKLYDAAPLAYPDSESLKDHKELRLTIDEAIELFRSSLVTQIRVPAKYIDSATAKPEKMIKAFETIRSAWQNNQPEDLPNVRADITISPHSKYSRGKGEVVDRGFSISVGMTGLWDGDHCRMRGY